jgi:hypothetical protein
VLAPFAAERDRSWSSRSTATRTSTTWSALLDELHAAKLTRFSINPLDDKGKQEVEKL